MYGGSSMRTAPLGYHCDTAAALPFPLLPLPQLTIPDEYHPHLAEFDALDETAKPLAHLDATSYASSGCSSCYDSPNSAPSHGDPTGASLMQRSISSHALLHRINGQYDYSLCPYPATCESTDLDSGSVRRVYSAGDLQRRMNGGALMDCGYKRSESPPPPLRSESSLIIEGMSRACRYSPEEKKERIERYRSKRHQRNFNKKIKYACRKTLADSRPRIRGRFARNDEIDQKSASHEVDDRWNLHMGGEEDEEEDDNWINFIDAFYPGI
ncbi:zinc finger protein CO3-like [Punica granatum]|uniref:CCT domain-containing protein n=2 Tax=Punica granatum TaxID=22663 RepID=A0A218W8N2_PUNGR|nr:zinc finger protein CO3-like [Punica granatum]OWM68849.1 hypothetical protein CDL15_Pgr025036 [Punica granatum]PKI31177.1 hypothetical protein CRG98_048423 [Punica granatum]